MILKNLFFAGFMIFFLPASAQIKIFKNFENANVSILKIKNDTVFFAPEADSNNTLKCWFYFGIANVKNKNLTLIEKINPDYSPAAPVYSYDRQIWYRTVATVGKNISFNFTPSQDTVFFATGFPYTYSQMLEFCDTIATYPQIDTFTLCKSETGLRVPLLKISFPSQDTPKYSVFIIARQHAFESISNYVLEGFVYELTDSAYTDFLKKTQIFIVPMMDVDNVFKGQSGRMQHPVDFNRDWNKNSHWTAVRTLKNFVIKTDSITPVKIFFDFHSTFPSPVISLFGYFNIYTESNVHYKKLEKFWKLFKKTSGLNPVKIKGGYSFNTFYADQYFSAYGLNPDFPKLNDLDFSCTLEFDWYKTPNNEVWTIEKLHELGKLLAKTLTIYAQKW